MIRTEWNSCSVLYCFQQAFLNLLSDSFCAVAYRLPFLPSIALKSVGNGFVFLLEMILVNGGKYFCHGFFAIYACGIDVFLTVGESKERHSREWVRPFFDLIKTFISIRLVIVPELACRFHNVFLIF